MIASYILLVFSIKSQSYENVLVSSMTNTTVAVGSYRYYDVHDGSSKCLQANIC